MFYSVLVLSAMLIWTDSPVPPPPTVYILDSSDEESDRLRVKKPRPKKPSNELPAWTRTQSVVVNERKKSKSVGRGSTEERGSHRDAGKTV